MLSRESTRVRVPARWREPIAAPSNIFTKRYRITFLTVIPSPYQRELFGAIARHDGLIPRVYYFGRTSPEYAWAERELPSYSEVLPGIALHALTPCCFLNPTATGRLRRESTDLVVVGDYFTLTNQLVMRDLNRRGVPWVFWGERPGLTHRSMLGRQLRRWAQRPIRTGATAIVGMGSQAQAAYRQLLNDDRPVFNIPYHCDLTRFLAIPRSFETRSPRPVRFLFSGQMIARKGVDILLDAFITLSRRYSDPLGAPRLTLLGDGPQRQHFQSRVPPALRDRIGFKGFVQPSALPDVFARADVFVLPSRYDGWGLVINEAIAAGMPVISTDRVGAAADLVEDGRNGFVVPADDAETLLNAMDRFITDPAMIEPFAARSRTIARRYRVECGAQRWYDVCRSLLETRGDPT